MRLVELKPRFLIYANGTLLTATTFAGAQGLEFRCPFGPGRIQVWFENRAPPAAPGLRWQILGGRGFDDLSLHPSIDAGASCGHVWINGGEVTRSG